jgi:hypothetical protein
LGPHALCKRRICARLHTLYHSMAAPRGTAEAAETT